MTRLFAVSPTGLASGAETVLRRVLEAGAAAGWEVRCACADGPFAASLGRAGVTRVHAPELRLPGGPKAVAVGLVAARTADAARVIRREARHADVVLVNGFHALPALRLASPRAPTVWLVHDVIRRPSWLKITAATKSAVSVAIAVSDAVAAPLRSAGLTVHVVRNGTPWPVAPATGRRQDPFVIGCAALLTSWKGQDVLLDAVGMLGRSDVIVELAGGQFPKDGPYVSSLHERADQPDLRGRVTFLGEVADSLSRIRSWTVAVSSSVEPEAGPLAPLEAMSVGIPLVATAHGGTPEVLGDAGLGVPPRDAPRMAAAIGRLLDEPDLWERCHAAGPRQIEAGLTVEAQMGAMLAELEAAAGRK